MKIEYNKDAMTVLSGAIEDMTHNEIHVAIDTEIQPYEQKLVVVEKYPNGIAKLQTVDNTGAICMEWHDVLTKPCKKCGAIMDKYNGAGLEYMLCKDCIKL